MNKNSCLVGIGAGLSGFVGSACDVPQMVLIDGCEVGCGKIVSNRYQKLSQMNLLLYKNIIRLH